MHGTVLYQEASLKSMPERLSKFVIAIWFRSVHLTIFQRVENNLWRRSNSCLTGRSYEILEVQSVLTQAGFTDIQVYDAQDYFYIQDWSVGVAKIPCSKYAP